MDAAVEEEPLVKAADTAEFACGGAGVDAVGAEVLEERRYVLLRTGEQDAVAGFEELGEGFEVAIVSFAGERAQSFFDAQVGHVFAEQAEIARGFHARFDYGPRLCEMGRRRIGKEPHSTRNQSH